MSAFTDFKAYFAVSIQGVLGAAGQMAGGLHYDDEYSSLTVSAAKRSVNDLRKSANEIEGAIVRFEAQTEQHSEEGRQGPTP